MKRLTTLLVLVVAALLFLQNDIFARGGGRGGGGGGRGGGGGGGYRGGGGGGGGYRGGGGMPASAGRSPAMSGGASARPAPRPAARPAAGAGGSPRPAAVPGAAVRPGTGAVGARPAAGEGGPRGSIAAGARPSAGQLNNFLNVPGPATGAVGTRPGAGGAAADFLQGGGGARPAQLPSRAGNGAAGAVAGVGVGVAAGSARNLSSNRAGRVENRQELQGNRQQRRDEVRDQVAENHPRLDFWSDHPGWARMRITRPYRWATWAGIAGWVGYGSGEPVSYAYGEDVYYEGDQVYYGEQPVATAEEYTEQADAIVASVPQTSPDSSEWLPLGVFALTQDGQASGVKPSLFMQLAISKEGIISGTLNNTATGQVQTLEGMADKKSQRVAFSVAGQKRPIIETGLSNLTQDTSGALIHFADGQTQQWLMVRLEDPETKK